MAKQHKNQKTKKIVKIVYFDEGSATDYIQISSGGSLINEKTHNKDLAASAQGSVSAEAGTSEGIGSRILRAIGIDVDARAGIAAEASFGSETVVRSIVTNTILTDFLSIVETESTHNEMPIATFDKRNIRQIPGSISSMSLLTPYFSMLRSGQSINAGEFDISLDKLDSTLSKAKGYVEFLGIEQGKEDIILRFNGLAFKNNYRSSNLPRMNLKLYAVKVGSCKLSELAADSELSMEGFNVQDNPDYTKQEQKIPEPAEKPLEIYDVILAGVQSSNE